VWCRRDTDHHGRPIGPISPQGGRLQLIPGGAWCSRALTLKVAFQRLVVAAVFLAE